MDSLQVSMLVFGLILVVGVQSGLGIRCYVCNSAYPSKVDNCENPTTEHFVKDCSLEFKDRGLNYTYCRKSAQTVGDDYRVIRSCASRARLDRACIDRTGTKAIKVKHCECEGDLCNTAPATSVNLALLSLVSGLLALVYHS